MFALEEINSGARLLGLDPERFAEVVQVARFAMEAALAAERRLGNLPRDVFR